MAGNYDDNEDRYDCVFNTIRFGNTNTYKKEENITARHIEMRAIRCMKMLSYELYFVCVCECG